MTPMPAYTPPATRHRSASHRYTVHNGELADCVRCNRPAADLVTERAKSFAQQVGHPENQGDAVWAELTRWYLADREDIEAGRPLRYVPDLP